MTRLALLLSLWLAGVPLTHATTINDLPARNAVEGRAIRACKSECPSDDSRCDRCWERNVACTVTLNRNVGDYWRKGMKFDLTGGGAPDELCQHGGSCIPLSSANFDRPCTIRCEGSGEDQYCNWERM